MDAATSASNAESYCGEAVTSRVGMGIAACTAAWVWCTVARADRHEATIAVRPIAEVARFADRGTDERAVAAGGGVAAGLRWGVRDWLDIGGELAASTFAKAAHDAATVPVLGIERTGTLTRTTRSAQLQATATVRLGVGWVPTIQLALGGGGRYRSAARLRREAPNGDLSVSDPDGEESEITIDVVASLRLGIDHRLTPRWTIGASIGASQCFGVGAPDMQVADAAFSLSYSWYPSW